VNPEDFVAALTRHGLFQSDMAQICGVTTRTIQNWASGRKKVPQSVALLLMALDEGALSLSWIAKRITRA